MSGAFKIPQTYWFSIEITPKDIENLHSYLFDRETPLTARDLALALIEFRIKEEREADRKTHLATGKPYLPKNDSQVGDELIFPSLEWTSGRVTARRKGVNPSIPEFDVITVSFGWFGKDVCCKPVRSWIEPGECRTCILG